MTQKNISCYCAQLSDGTSALELPAARFRVIEGGAGRRFRYEVGAPRELAPKGIPANEFKKLLVLAVVCAALLCCIGVLTDAISAAGRDELLASAETSVIYVRPGDTLWAIASEHPVNGCSTNDVVAFIEYSNGLEVASLQPGQSLVVPA